MIETKTSAAVLSQLHTMIVNGDYGLIQMSADEPMVKALEQAIGREKELAEMIEAYREAVASLEQIRWNAKSGEIYEIASRIQSRISQIKAFKP